MHFLLHFPLARWRRRRRRRRRRLYPTRAFTVCCRFARCSRRRHPIRGLCDVVLAACQCPSPPPQGRSGQSSTDEKWWLAGADFCTELSVLGMYVILKSVFSGPALGDAHKNGNFLQVPSGSREHRVVSEILVYVYFVSLFSAAFFHNSTRVRSRINWKRASRR